MSALQKVQRWVHGHSIADGRYDHYDSKWSVVLVRQHQQVFSTGCTKRSRVSGGSCSSCAVMWTHGQVKPPFYGHVVHALKQGSWELLYCDPVVKHQHQIRQLQQRARAKQSRVSAKSTAAALDHQADPQLSSVLKRLPEVWSSLSQSKKDRLADQLHNEGRIGKGLCGRRWTAKSSLSFARRLAAHSSTKFLHWVDTNISALPTTATTFNRDVVMKIAHWGSQEHLLRACANGQLSDLDMRGSDLTFSVDEMAIDQSITHTRVSPQGAPAQYRLDGFANCCDSLKYGAAQTVLASSFEEVAQHTHLPVANQAFIGLVKKHTYDSAVVISYVSLTDGSYVTADIIRIFHEQETAAAKLGLKLANFAADNLGPQLAFSQAICRGFTADEDTALLDNVRVAQLAHDDPALSWLGVAAMHNRPIYHVRNRAKLLLDGVEPPPGSLVIPVDGWFHAFNGSATAVPLCISPEYPHTSRLIVETVWKPAKLLIMSFARSSGPALASDYQQLYHQHISDMNLTYACVDQTDNQNDKRAHALGSLPIVQGLAKHVYASRGSQLFSLVLAAYFGIFRARLDASAEQPLSVSGRLVLCGFVAAFFVYQPLGILTAGKRFKYTLKHNSFTSATRSSVLMHVSGFIAIQLKGTHYFQSSTIVPEVFGEKCNENLHSMLRDVNQQHSSAVSPQQLLKRLGEVATEMHEDASGYFERVSGRKEAHRAATGDLDSLVWKQRATRQSVNEFVMLGISTCQDLLRKEGYAAVLSKYPTLRQAYTALITLTKPASSTSHVKWQWMLPPPASPEVMAIHAAARAPDVVKLDVQMELASLFDALSPPQLAVLNAVPVLNADNVGLSVIPTSSMSGGIVRDASGQAFNIGAVVHRLYNQSKRKQSTAMKQKYAEPNLRDTWSHLLRKPVVDRVLPAGDLSATVSVGQTRVCYFIGADGTPEMAIGLVRSIRAAISSISKSGRTTSKLRFYSSTHDLDGSASFFCFPYYKWNVGSNRATLCSDEMHEYFPLLLDGESDEVHHVGTLGSGGNDGAVDGAGCCGGSNQVSCLRFPVSVTLSLAINTLQLSDADVVMMTELARKVRLLAVPRLPAARHIDGLNSTSDSSSNTSASSSDSGDGIMLRDLARGAATVGRGGVQLGAHSAAPLQHGACSTSDTCDSGDDLPILH